jgi:hypothetical protein
MDLDDEAAEEDMDIERLTDEEKVAVLKYCNNVDANLNQAYIEMHQLFQEQEKALALWLSGRPVTDVMRQVVGQLASVRVREQDGYWVVGDISPGRLPWEKSG